MKFSMKRLAAFALALVMVLGMLPVVNNSVSALTATTTVTGGPSDLGMTVVTEYTRAPKENVWVADGSTLTGSLVGFNNGSNAVYQKATATLTLTNNKTVDAVLSFDYESAVTKDGDTVTVNGSTALSGSVSVTLASGESITVVLYANGPGRGANGASISITNLSLLAADAGTVTTTFEAPAYGSYTVTYGEITKTLTPGVASVVANNAADVQYTMTVTPGDGSKFLGWYNVTTGEYLSTATTYSATYDSANTIKPIVVSDTLAVFMVGNNYYADLDEAVTYAVENDYTQITLVDSGTITKSDLGIPAGMTLLIPMDDAYTPMGAEPGYSVTAVTPYAYLTLTLADGVSLNVSGTVEVEGEHTTLQANKTIYGAGGAYGAIYMSPNSSITLNDGAILYAWGYVYGEGTIAANSGSKVYEIMQVTDYPGGSNASGAMDTAPDADDVDNNYPYSNDGILDNDYVKTFPFMQYYVQNIEVALTLYAGATEYVMTTVTVGGDNHASTPPIEFIGNNGMFVPVNGSITKDYDPSTDRLIVDVDGEAKVNGITLDMSEHEFGDAMAGFMNGETSFDTSKYILALNGNITININSGKTTIGQDMALLPGVEIYVDNGATLVIAAQPHEEGAWNNLTYDGSFGHNIYVYDIDNWGKYIFSNKYLAAASYSPTLGRYVRTVSDLKDVKIDINGTVICDGFVYSTVTIDPETYEIVGGGAQVISSGKTGKIIMNNGAGTEMSAFRTNGQAKEALIDIDSVWLQNGNGTFLQTAGAEAGATFGYCATHDIWYEGSCDRCSPPTELTITWIVNGVDLTVDCEYNTVPVYPNGTPTKAQSGCTTYTFAGWSTSADGEVLETLPAATTEATYYAIFTEGTSHTSSEFNYTSKEGTHSKTYKCCGADAGVENCSGGTAWCNARPVCALCDGLYGSIDSTNHVGDTDADHICNSCNNEMNTCADNDADHYCDYSGCGDKLTECSDNAKDGDHNCDYTGCGEPVADSVCYGGEADCTNGPVCEDCGDEYDEALGHGHTQGYEYTDLEDGNHSVTCKDCGTVTVASEAHTYTEGVCACGVVKTYTLTLNFNGGTLSDEVKEMLINAGIEVTDTEVVMKVSHGELGVADVFGLTKVGHTISGFVDQTGKTYEVGEEFVLTGDLTMTTQWKPNTYTLNITYKDTVLKYTLAYGEKLPEIATDPIVTEDGKYTFWYWADMDAEHIARVDELPETMPASDLNYEAMLLYTGWKYEDGERQFWYGQLYSVTGWWCINDSNEVVTDGSGSWYYFDEDTYNAATGVTRVPYPTEAINGITYEANAEDVAYGGESFIDKDTGLFYFGEDGKFQSNYTDAVIDQGALRWVINGLIEWHPGMIENQGSYFYFVGDKTVGGNILATGDVYVTRNTTDFETVHGGIYTFGTDGALFTFHGITENSMLFSGKRYYENGQLMIGNGLTKVDENYIYVNAYGNLIVSAEYYVPTNSYGIDRGIYAFDEDGFIVIPEADPVKNGFYYEDGAWYYYVDGVKGYCAGLINTDGILWYETADAEGVENVGWVYVKSDGSLVSNTTYYVTNVNGHESIASGDKCVFGADCLMQNAKNGIIDGYYYVNNQIAYGAGVVVIDGSYYYVKSNGQVVVNQTYWTTNVGNSGVMAKLYTFDENGVFTPEFTADAKNGIVDGYYYVDGHIAYCADLIEIEEGKYIYVKSNGELATGEYWTTNHNDVLKEGLYDFGEDGILVIE